MNTTFLGINSSGTTSSLNSDLINKLKTSETNSLNKNLETKLSEINNSETIFSKFKTQMNSLLETTKQTTDGYSATTSNTKLNFSVSNKELLKEDFLSFNVSSLAKKDVYQTNKFTSENDLFSQGDFTIKGQTITTANKTNKDIVTELNAITGVNASIENVGTNEKRIVIKSLSGTENALNSSLEKLQSASNLSVSIDGIDYEYNENTFDFNGLKITANTTGETSINIKKDTNEVKTRIEDFISKYNTLNSFATDTIINNPDFKISKDKIKSSLNDLKSELFSNDVFRSGISLDKTGNLSFLEENANYEKINTFLNNVNTTINSNINNLNTETDNISKTKKEIEETKKKNIDYLERKYETMSMQFSEYNRIINSFESSFSALKNMINYQNN